MIQLREDEVNGKVSKMKDAQDALGEEYQKMKENGFLINRGDAKVIFDLNKGYAEQLVDGVFDYNKIGWKDEGLKTESEIRQSKKAIDKNAIAMPESILSKFKCDALIYSDYMNRIIGISKSTVETHLTGKYLEPSELRHQTYHLIKKIVASPDEVYFSKYKGVWQ